MSAHDSRPAHVHEMREARERAKMLLYIELDVDFRYEQSTINRTALCNSKHSCDAKPRYLLHFHCTALCVFDKWFNFKS